MEQLAAFAVNFAKAFVPIFFAMDAVGVLPLFVSLTEGVDEAQRRRIIRLASLTALAVAVGFVLVGKTIFRLMGVTVADFMVAGGVVLFVIAAMDLLTETKFERRGVHEIAAVPLGTPLMVGPAVLTTSLIMVDAYGLAETLAAIAANVLAAMGIFGTAGPVVRVLGRAGSRAVSKVASLILAAIAVMLIRRGLPEVVSFIRQTNVAP